MRQYFLLLLVWMAIIAIITPATAMPAQCYLNEFNPSDYPIKIADCLNYEEVFKNYQYYETSTNHKSRVLTVNFYQQSKLIKTQKYKIRKNQKLVLIKP